MTPETATGPRARVDAASAYRRPAPPALVTLSLDGNEGARPDLDPLLAAIRDGGPELLRRYPDTAALEALLAGLHGVAPSRVVVTAGADEAIDRCCRAYLAPGRSLLTADPTFEMLERYASLAGGRLVDVPWRPGPFPTDAVLARLDASVAIVAVVSPNNPTGEVASLEDVTRIAAAAPHALVLLDHAYVEYADQDLTAAALAWPNVVVTRTLSKAWGLAGCRVGFALGAVPIIDVLRAAGGPYPVAAPSLAVAAAQLEHGAPVMEAHVARVRRERAGLTALLETRGMAPRRSQANFVYADLGPRAGFVCDALASRGVRVRDFPDRPSAATALRITLPGDAGGFAQLTAALDLALAPDALLLDLDGVLADVAGSYRACIAATAGAFGVTITPDDILRMTLAGDANNDWVLTQRLLAARGVARSLEDITACFQSHYLGSPGRPGLRETERAIVSRRTLEALAARLPLAIVTGRPRAEAEWFLAHAGLEGVARTLVAMEDAPLKPDPAPVRLAMQRLGAARGWMVGDTPDDMRAARAAGALAFGVAAPGQAPDVVGPALREAGAALLLHDLPSLEALW